MNKDDLIRSVAEQMQTTKASASQAVGAIFDAITESLKNGDSLTLIGFGSFKVTKRAARNGRNPRTGEPLSIPAATVPSFAPGKVLRDAVNGKKL
jgi:DNA-binding protein HU-beta